jgi:hypothetical protein
MLDGADEVLGVNRPRDWRTARNRKRLAAFVRDSHPFVPPDLLNSFTSEITIVLSIALHMS